MQTSIDMAINTTVANVKTSFNNCLEDDDFIPRFYEILFESCPPIGYELEDKSTPELENILKSTMDVVFSAAVGDEIPEDVNFSNTLLYNPNFSVF